MISDLKLPTGPALALILGLLLAIVPATGMAESPPDGPNGGQGDDQETNGNRSSADENRTGNQTNETGRDANGSQTTASEDARSNNTSENRSDRQAADDERRSEPGADQRRAEVPSTAKQARADPVEIRELANGFTSRPPTGSARPSVSVDTARAHAQVVRDDVTPLHVQFESVLVYADEDGDGAYDLGEPVVNRTELRASEHRLLTDDENRTRSVVYPLDGGGELILQFGFGTDVERQVGAKVDVILQGMAFESPGTRVALGSRVDASGGLEVAEISGQPAIVGTQGDDVPYLSWVPDVQVDGVDHEVGWSVHLSESASDQSAIVYWSYPQGDQIVHDPQLGITSAIEDLAGQSGAFLLALAATLAVLSVGYAVRRRGRL